MIPMLEVRTGAGTWEKAGYLTDCLSCEVHQAVEDWALYITLTYPMSGELYPYLNIGARVLMPLCADYVLVQPSTDSGTAAYTCLPMAQAERDYSAGDFNTKFVHRFYIAEATTTDAGYISVTAYHEAYKLRWALIENATGAGHKSVDQAITDIQTYKQQWSGISIEGHTGKTSSTEFIPKTTRSAWECLFTDEEDNIQARLGGKALAVYHPDKINIKNLPADAYDAYIRIGTNVLTCEKSVNVMEEYNKVRPYWLRKTQNDERLVLGDLITLYEDYDDSGNISLDYDRYAYIDVTDYLVDPCYNSSIFSVPNWFAIVEGYLNLNYDDFATQQTKLGQWCDQINNIYFYNTDPNAAGHVNAPIDALNEVTVTDTTDPDTGVITHNITGNKFTRLTLTQSEYMDTFTPFVDTVTKAGQAWVAANNPQKQTYTISMTLCESEGITCPRLQQVVHIDLPEYNVYNATARITALTYDALAERYTEVTIGNAKQSIAKSITKLVKKKGK